MRTLLLSILSVLIGTMAPRPAIASTAAICEGLFAPAGNAQYVSLAQKNAHLFENPSPHEFKFTMYEDQVVIETMGGFAESAEGRRVFPPVVFPIRRAWRLVVNHTHRLVMVVGNEPLILSFDGEKEGWRVLNPHRQIR